ncbi:phosphate uptake regulator PhoU [Halomicroarcula sp. S1AR25-4]|uniref:phosphate uptake regulator PhoU n=1 Tax=Haloarcula sp. S1AR25-4 TaxID=2950538 RepID=UPI0028747333|nr:phosphate uptake regulator PhoU [Halomicroarcula sp. S1AR25-4]MDS0279331.1 phosphate uptake regulator PhoU [Halomicroarcula sp. S1AR25-4]
METRKIQQVGGGTYTVSLPKEWAEVAGIETGSIVDLHTHIDGVLVIQPQERDRETTGRLTLTVPHADSTCIERALRAAYAAGVEVLEFDAPDEFSDEQRRAVERVTRTLTGVTVTESTATTMTVRTLLDADEVSITQSVRQLQFVVLSMHRDATAALTGPTAVDSPADRDDQADRLYAMVDRYFERGLARFDEMDALGLTRSELFVCWVTARELERVGDHAERIARTAEELDGRIDDATAEEITDLAATARDIVEDAVHAIVGDAGVDAAREALHARDALRSDVEALDRRLFESTAAAYRLTHVLDSIGRTAEHGGNVAELALRTAIRDGELGEHVGDATVEGQLAE